MEWVKYEVAQIEHERRTGYKLVRRRAREAIAERLPRVAQEDWKLKAVSRKGTKITQRRKALPRI
jgi:hypothetical protein